MFEIKSEPVSFLVYLKPQCIGGPAGEPADGGLDQLKMAMISYWWHILADFGLNLNRFFTRC